MNCQWERDQQYMFERSDFIKLGFKLPPAGLGWDLTRKGIRKWHRWCPKCGKETDFRKKYLSNYWVCPCGFETK